MKRFRASGLLCAVCALAACAAPSTPPATVPGPADAAQAAPGAATQAKPATTPTGRPATTIGYRAPMEGVVKLPSSLVAAGGMNLVAAGGMNLVAAGGMNLVAAGGMNLVAAGGMNLVAAGGMNLVAAGGMNYDLLDVDTRAVQGVVVYLCDALGNPIPGLSPVQCDANGKFTIPDVPAGYTVVVNAAAPFEDGKVARMVTLARSGDVGWADVGTGTTMAAIRAAAGRTGGELGDLDVVQFRAAADVAAAALTNNNAPDFRDVAAVAARAAEIEAQNAAMADALAVVRKRLDAAPSSLTETPIYPTPSPTATPVPSTPRPFPTEVPSPSTPAPTCGPSKIHTFKPIMGGVTRVVFRSYTPSEPIKANWPKKAELLFQNGATFPTELPEGCAIRVEIFDTAGTMLRSKDDFVIPPGASDPVLLPF